MIDKWRLRIGRLWWTDADDVLAEATGVTMFFVRKQALQLSSEEEIL